MRIKITDIPPAGRDLEFIVEAIKLNERIVSSKDGTKHFSEKDRAQGDLRFSENAKSNLHLSLEGSTVIIQGAASTKFISNCARCAEETEKSLEIPLNLVLKPIPLSNRPDDLDEDLNFGFYSEQEVDCSACVEDYLILALPYSINCKSDCRGLCLICGANLNLETCSCQPEHDIDSPFKILKTLKI